MRCLNMDRKEKNRISSVKRRKKLREEIIILLGGKCSNPNCLVPNGCRDIRCLQIDHIHRKIYKGSHADEMYYRHVLEEIKAGSKDYQLLCANCNWIKRVENHEIFKIY